MPAQLFACTCCQVRTTTPNWSENSADGANVAARVLGRDHRRIARCPSCDGVMRPIDTSPSTLRAAA